MAFWTRRRRLTTIATIAVLMGGATPVFAAPNDPEDEPRAKSSAAGDRTQDVRREVKGGRAKNVILFIGDGMGDSEITAARNYARGAASRLSMDELPLTGAYTTYSVQKGDPSTPVYVTDSAASGTGWATGTKTYNGAISVDANGNPVPTVLELAKRSGYRTGDVSTAEIQDATPAVLGAHVSDRGCAGPEETSETCPDEAKENGGEGSISEQLVQTRPDVLLGGGATYFDQKARAGEFEGKPVLEQAKASGYQIATDADGLRAANGERPLLGLFAEGNMEVQWSGPQAEPGGTEPSKCEDNPELPAEQPTLADMTRKAIKNLSNPGQGSGADPDKGFFLQVEGASIDKEDHAANPCGQLGETVGFDDAVAAGMSFARSNPDTLVVVSADHGHTSQIISGTESPGSTATLITKDGAEMTLNYATAEPGESQDHTGTQVRIAGYGPQAANVVGVTDQTDLFTTMKRALALR